jgi:hypothetical protein
MSKACNHNTVLINPIQSALIMDLICQMQDYARSEFRARIGPALGRCDWTYTQKNFNPDKDADAGTEVYLSVGYGYFSLDLDICHVIGRPLIWEHSARHTEHYHTAYNLLEIISKEIEAKWGFDPLEPTIFNKPYVPRL